MITVTGEKITVRGCAAVIIVPEIAEREAGYIKTLTTAGDADAKHEFFALAQMVLFQYEDEELKVEPLFSPLSIRHGQDEQRLERGLVICRDHEGGLRLLAHEEMNVKKLLEATHRHCTRWVRLDICGAPPTQV